jgi:PKD repeat protein
MNKKLLIGVLSAASFFVSTAYSQEQSFSCGSHIEMKKLYAEDPSLEADYFKLLNKFKENKIINGKSQTNRVIPVVFHILHENGSENISDAQVYDQMTILNRDYQKLNADTALVVSPFDTIIGLANIEFRLATIDPQGNCTNGIEHIYSHLTNGGDDYSKLNQWKRSDYLNVWVVKTIGSAGVAGYAYYPTGVTGVGFWRDGIIILNDYIGSIGSSSPFRSRALTHEIGHYLGLPHTWGNDNDPGNTASCGQDDGIEDTPNCIGQTTCNLTANTCNDTVPIIGYWGHNDVIDNVQNYMEYSYCSVMFTKQQTAYMNNVLDQTTSQRNNLWQATNLVATGTSTMPGPTCIPIADFCMDGNGASPNIGNNFGQIIACAGDPIQFIDQSYNAVITSWNWSIPGATPSTSTSQNPTVVFNTPGWYNVTLTVGNSAGTNTKTKNIMLYVQGDWADYVGPFNETFNSNANFWMTNNPEPGTGAFYRVTSGGKGNTACFKLFNYHNTMMDPQYSDGYFYNDRLGGSKDYLITPAFDLRYTTNINVSFDYAFGTRSNSSTDLTEKLIAYVSTDCGKTWTQRLTVSGTSLLTAGYIGNTDFTPTNDNQWKTANFTYTSNMNSNKVRFKFEFIASDFSSNFYFDNFNINGTLGVEENGEMASISIAPNPVASGSQLAVEIPSNTQGMTLVVTDLNGATVSTLFVPASSGYETVQVPMNVAKGCYILTALQGNTKSTQRVIVY